MRYFWLLLLLFSKITFADQETQTWMQVILQEKLTSQVRLWAEVQPRYSVSTGKFSTILIRPALGWQFTPALSVWAGYAWTPLFNPTPRDEHRIWGQAFLVLQPFHEGSVFAQRLRMETRVIDGLDTGFRLRHQARLSVPIADKSPFSLLAYDELFFNLKTVSSGIVSGFDQNRLFIGAFYKPCDKLALDVGYLLNHVRRPNAVENRLNHVAMMTLYLSLGLF